MFKFFGSLLVIVSSVFIFSQKILEYWFSYRFLKEVTDIVKKIQYENSANRTYKSVFEKIGFDKVLFIAQAKRNKYINGRIIKDTEYFFDNLGKRDVNSEKIYIDYSLKLFTDEKNNCLKLYRDIKKTYLLSGVAAGLLITIILV